MGSTLIGYFIFCLATSTTWSARIARKAVRLSEHPNPIIFHAVSFITSFIIAPVVFIMLFSPKAQNAYINEIIKGVEENY